MNFPANPKPADFIARKDDTILVIKDTRACGVIRLLHGIRKTPIVIRMQSLGNQVLIEFDRGVRFKSVQGKELRFIVGYVAYEIVSVYTKPRCLCCEAQPFRGLAQFVLCTLSLADVPNSGDPHITPLVNHIITVGFHREETAILANHLMFQITLNAMTDVKLHPLAIMQWDKIRYFSANHFRSIAAEHSCALFVNIQEPPLLAESNGFKGC